MSLNGDTQAYERWLAIQCDVLKHDLKRKHKKMSQDAFVFLRATYYRWARKILDWCPEVAKAPKVRAIGDAHTENFGIWRDGEGRLVWGVNDFDEAAVMPYTLDLLRLATSAALAPDPELSLEESCTAILAGYREGLITPRPILLDEREIWMRDYVVITDEDRQAFWDEVKNYPDAEPPRSVKAQLIASLPKRGQVVRFCTRVKGTGGLGRPRYVAVAEWRGGQIVREAKAFVPSAWNWARGLSPDRSIFLKVATGRFRSPDPLLDTDERFICRRIAADSTKVELGSHAGSKLKHKLLHAMGFDLGAIHAAQPRHARRIGEDLGEQRASWLISATETASATIKKEHRDWRALMKA
jgi:hypothetical protein